MRSHVEAARDRGIHLAFLGVDVGYWQTRFEANASGEPDRRLVPYKEAAGDLDPFAIDGDPRNDRYITGRFRDRPVSRPEERLVGVMYAADPVDGDIVVSNARHWAFAGTSLHDGDALRGLLGYEVDAIYGDASPPGLEPLARSPFVDRGQTQYADMTIYTAESGALVFATGSMQWNWGLDVTTRQPGTRCLSMRGRSRSRATFSTGCSPSGRGPGDRRTRRCRAPLCSSPRSARRRMSGSRGYGEGLAKAGRSCV
jgi:N,N-dimethylformamidase beta subunit-like protein